MKTLAIWGLSTMGALLGFWIYSIYAKGMADRPADSHATYRITVYLPGSSSLAREWRGVPSYYYSHGFVSFVPTNRIDREVFKQHVCISGTVIVEPE